MGKRKWTGNEKIMAGLIVLLLVGIAIRWGYIRQEAGEPVMRYFRPDSVPLRIPGLPEPASKTEATQDTAALFSDTTRSRTDTLTGK